MKNFDINNTRLLIEVLIGCFTVSFLGGIFGLITSKLLKSNSNETLFLFGLMSSPHTTSLPLILIEVLYPVLQNMKINQDNFPLGNSQNIPTAKDRGMLYIVLNSIFSNIWRWTITYNCIQMDEIQIKEIGFIKIDNNSELTENLLEKNINENNQISRNNTMKIKRNKTIGCIGIFKEILNTPIIVSFLSICLCLNDNVRMAFLQKNTILSDNFLSVNTVIARCFNFSVIFVLGLNFANLPIFKNGENINRNDLSNIEEKEELFSAWKIFILTFVKLLIVPLVGCPIIYYYRTAGILNDDVMIFLYMFMMAAPNAINIIVVCSVKRCWLKNISVIMVVSYVCSVVTLTFSITLFLYILT